MSSKTNRVDLEQPGANMYGCVPCPKCKSKYRVPLQGVDGTDVIACECGLEEVAQPEDRRGLTGEQKP